MGSLAYKNNHVTFKLFIAHFEQFFFLYCTETNVSLLFQSLWTFIAISSFNQMHYAVCDQACKGTPYMVNCLWMMDVGDSGWDKCQDISSKMLMFWSLNEVLMAVTHHLYCIYRPASVWLTNKYQRSKKKRRKKRVHQALHFLHPAAGSHHW